MMSKALGEFGAIDILVNNAGIQFVAPIDEFPVDKWNAVIAINLTASFHTVRLALPAMKAKKWGRVINIASAHALVASPFKSAYVAAKHGIAGLTKTVALEVAEAGITMNAICPGYVWTPLVQKQIPDTAKARGITEEQVIRDVLLPRSRRRSSCRSRKSRHSRRSSRATPPRRSPARYCRSKAAGPRTSSTRQPERRSRKANIIGSSAMARAASSRGNGTAKSRRARAPRAGGPGDAGRRRAGRLPGRRLPGAARGRHRARLGDRHLDRRDQRRADRRQRARGPARARCTNSGAASSSAPAPTFRRRARASTRRWRT